MGAKVVRERGGMGAKNTQCGCNPQGGVHEFVPAALYCRVVVSIGGR